MSGSDRRGARALPPRRPLRDEAPTENHAPVPLFLKVVIAVLAVWAAYYLVAFFRPAPGYLHLFHAAVPAATGTPVDRGRYYFHTVGCMNCHTVDGYGGTLGPNLSHIAAGGTLTPAFLRRWLANPARVMPGATMPRLPLTKTEVDDITAYLETLR